MAVIDFAQAKKESEPHMSGPCKCLACKHEWGGVAPVGSVWLDCPSCELERGRFINPVGIGDTYWACNCENDLFHMTPDGIYCPNCGEWQHGF